DRAVPSWSRRPPGPMKTPCGTGSAATSPTWPCPPSPRRPPGRVGQVTESSFRLFRPNPFTPCHHEPVVTDPVRGEGPGVGLPARVQSVDRALRLLEVVAATAPRGETVKVLAARCDINRATAWRLLGTLEARGLVERDPATNRYRIGLAMIRMSASAGYDGLVRRTRHI